jgi:riboflavin kinase/FMN adenylyltransferase
VIIYRSLEEIVTPLPKPVVTLGNFDGVHIGHREIFRRIRAEARRIGGSSVVVTFHPHPLKVLHVGKEIHLINTYAEKEKLLAAAGIDYLVVIPFNEAFAAITPRSFIRDILIGRIGVHTIYIGYDYAFGRNREGRVPYLVSEGRELGFSVQVLEPINNGSEIYSSSAIRRLIAIGDLAGVTQLLGRNYSVGGTVVAGHQRGSGLGFPTANIATDKELLPADGVYAVKVRIGEHLYDGACNIGRNPTFGNHETSIEVFLLNYSGDLYGRAIRLLFVERIRGERKFTGAEALKEAIAVDVSRCREILQQARIVEYQEFLGEPGDA